MPKEPVFTRREMLRWSASVIAGTYFMPAFLTRTVWSLEQAPRRQPDERFLVVVQLGGGNDGLNTVIPFRNEEYYKARPTLAVPKKEVLRLTDDLGLHPEMRALADLFEQGDLAIVQAVGYPNPNRSHFRSMEIWHTAVPERRDIQHGWLGRFFDNACNGCPLPQAVHFGLRVAQALRGEKADIFALPRQQEPELPYARILESLDRLLQEGHLPPEVLFVAHSELQLLSGWKEIAEALRKGRSRAEYPDTPFAYQLKTIVRLITGGLRTRIYYAHLTGFDTHTNQLARHPALLREFSEGLAAFVRDLKAARLWPQVLVLVFSEFGRRLQENGNQGTDHGTVLPVFLLGGALRPGFHGQPPDLRPEALDELGDPRMRVDFRQIYATILRDWLRANPEPILLGQFPPLQILRT